MSNELPPFDFWRGFTIACDVAMAAHASAAELERRRARRLSELLAWAAERSPLYRRVLKGREVERTPLSDLPVMHKTELMARFDTRVTDPQLHLDDVLRFVAEPSRIADPLLGRYLVWESSGSSGVRGIFVQDAAALAVYDALEALRRPRPFSWERMFDPWYLRERIAFVGATGGHFASAVSAQRLRRLNPAMADRIHDISFLQAPAHLAAQLEEVAPTIVATYPSAAILLAEEQAAGRLHISPREVWTGGETLTPPMRGFIEKELACRVTHSYGASEFLALAVECSEGELHLNSDWAILEAVDRHGRPVADGAVGERALLTNLANRVQPLIRYDLGDRITVRAGRCACGSHLPAISVQGRSDDMLRVPGAGRAQVSVLPLALCTVLEDEAGLYDFQLEQTAPGRLELHTAMRGAEADDALSRGRQALLRFLGNQHAGDISITTRNGQSPRRGAGGKVQRIVASVGAGK